MKNKNPYVSDNVDYDEAHPVAARLRDEGRRDYEENIRPYEKSIQEQALDYDEEYARDMGWKE